MKRNYLLGLLIALLALLLRLHHIGWGLPDWFEEAVSVKRAWEFWTWGVEGFDFDPRFFIYPSLHFYMQFAVQAILLGGGYLLGAYPDASSFQLAYYVDPGLFLLAGRVLTAVLGSATVFLVFLAGWRLAGASAAVPAALFLAGNAVHVEKSRFVEVDVAMTFFAALSYLFFLKYADRGARRNLWLAAAAVGLAAATKYPGALLIVNLPAALWIRGERPVSGKLIFSGLLALLVFAAATPYVFLDFDAFRNDFAGQVHHMREGHFGREAEGAAGAWRHFTSGFGVSLLLLAAVGGAAALRSRTKAFLLAPLPILLFALLSVSRMQDPHYPLPVFPPIALLAAFALGRIVPLSGPRRRFLLAAATLVLLLDPGARILDLDRRLSAPDTRRLAREWIEQNIRPESLVLTEPHGPQLYSTARREEYAEAPEFRKIRDRLLDALDARPVYATFVIPSYDVSWWRSARFYRFEPYQWYDYIVLSGSIRGRYRDDPDRYPVQNRFYDEVNRRFRSVRIFAPEGGLGPTIEIYERAAPPVALPEIRLDPAGKGDETYRTFMLKQGVAYERRGLDGPAAALYRALVEHDRDDPEPFVRLGTLLGRTANAAAGIPYLERGVEIDPADRRARRNLAVLLCRAGEIEKGARQFEILLAENDGDGETHLDFALSLLVLGRTDRAIRHFERFLSLSPGHPKADEVGKTVERIRAPDRSENPETR